MAAIVEIVEANGPEEYLTSLEGISSLAYKSMDSHALAQDSVYHPMLIPQDGYYWSAIKWWKFRLKSLGGATSLSSFKVWWEGTFPTGVEVFTVVSATYAVIPAQHLTSISDLPLAGLVAASSNYTSLGSAITVPGTLDAVGETTDYIAHVMRCTNRDPETLSTTPYFTYQWTET